MKPKEKPNPRYAPCKHCGGKVTKQTVELYNPKDPNGGEVWHCSMCKQNVEWTLKLKHRK